MQHLRVEEQIAARVDVVLDKVAVENRAKQYAEALAERFPETVSADSRITLSLGSLTIGVAPPPPALPPQAPGVASVVTLVGRRLSEVCSGGTSLLTIDIVLSKAVDFSALDAEFSRLSETVANYHGEEVRVCSRSTKAIDSFQKFASPPPAPPSPSTPPPPPPREGDPLSFYVWAIASTSVAVVLLLVVCCFCNWCCLVVAVRRRREHEEDERQRAPPPLGPLPANIPSMIGLGRVRTAPSRSQAVLMGLPVNPPERVWKQ